MSHGACSNSCQVSEPDSPKVAEGNTENDTPSQPDCIDFTRVLFHIDAFSVHVDTCMVRTRQENYRPEAVRQHEKKTRQMDPSSVHTSKQDEMHLPQE